MAPSLPADCSERFRFQRELARGGFGAVYLATQMALDRPAAVKLLDVKGAAEEIQRFLEEARITAALTHPSIVIVLDCGYSGSVPWIAYEYLDGGTLRSRLEKGALPPHEAAAAVEQVCEALHAAHERGVLHRDVKPDNVFVLPGNRVKIADFGIAKLTQSASIQTKTGIILGTPGYVAPEQVQGLPASARSDVYAAGVMLYELITGEVPFGQGSLLQILTARVERDPVPPRTRVPDLAPELDAAIMRALARDPAARWPTARAFAEALGACLETPPAGTDAPVLASISPGPRSSLSGRTSAISMRTRAANTTAAQSYGGAQRPSPSASSVSSSTTRIGASALQASADPSRLAVRIFLWTGLLVLGAWIVRQSYLMPPPPPPPSRQPDLPLSTPHVSRPAHAIRVSRLLTIAQEARVQVHVHPPAPLTLSIERDGVLLDALTQHIREAQPASIATFSNLKPDAAYVLEVRAEGEAAPVAFPFVTRAPDFNAWYADKEKLMARAESNGIDAFGRLPDLGSDIERMGDFRAAERMVSATPKALLISDPSIRHLAWLGFQMRSLAVVQSTVDKVRDDGARPVTVNLVEVARRLGRPEIARALLAPALFDGEYEELALHVVNLGALGGKPAFDTILTCGARPMPPPASAVGRALFLADPERARALFKQWLAVGSGASPVQRSWAILGLVHDHSQAAVALLGSLLEAPESLDRRLAARALAESHAVGAAQALLAGALARPDQPSVLWDAARAAMKLGDPGIRRLTLVLPRVMLGGPTPDVRAAAAGVAALMPGPELSAPLERLLDDPAGPVASAAAWALARRGPVQNIGALRRLVLSPRDVHGAAAWALSRQASSDPAKTLSEAARSLPTGQLAPTERMHAAVLGLLLKHLGHAAADPLIERLSREDGVLSRAFREFGSPDAPHAPALPADARSIWMFPFVGYELVRIAQPGFAHNLVCHELWPREARIKRASGSISVPTRVSVLDPEGWYRPPVRVEEKRPMEDIWISPVDPGAGEPLGELAPGQVTGLQILRFWQPKR